LRDIKVACRPTPREELAFGAEGAAHGGLGAPSFHMFRAVVEDLRLEVEAVAGG